MNRILRPALAVLAAAAAFSSPACAQAPRTDAIAAGTFAYNRAAPLDLRDSLETAANGLEIRRISFASPRGGRATGLLYVPQRPGRRGGIVMLHGAPGSARSISAIAESLARRNAVVLSIDAPFARRGTDMVTMTPQDSADHVQLIVDLQRAVDVLLARPDVDPARIAFVGGSYGGAVGTMYAAVDPRPVTYVLFVPDGGLVHHMADANGGRPERMAELPEAVWNRWVAAMRPVEGLGYISRARPGSILFQNGRADEFVPAAKAAELHRAAGPSHTVKWYESGHRLPRQARLDQFQWLHEHIGTDAVTAQERAEAAAEAPATAAAQARG
ncbi:alpha/beta hydrolase family protein [Longimicrobium sp.]|uniref:alpha/beta hydrolase family protein n=1 Tax=Longimicrobium sp. TaxID=2029185 RepID=UPI002EDA9299